MSARAARTIILPTMTGFPMAEEYSDIPVVVLLLPLIVPLFDDITLLLPVVGKIPSSATRIKNKMYKGKSLKLSSS